MNITPHADSHWDCHEAALILKRPTKTFGRESNGILMTPAEFDRAEFEEGWRYELINGVLIVSPIPSNRRNRPQRMARHILLDYQETHPSGILASTPRFLKGR